MCTMNTTFHSDIREIISPHREKFPLFLAFAHDSSVCIIGLAGSSERIPIWMDKWRINKLGRSVCQSSFDYDS